MSEEITYTKEKDNIVKQIQSSMLLLNKEQQKLTNEFSQMQDEMKALNKGIGKIKTIVEEGGLENNSATGNSSTIIDEKDLELKIKKILFEDKDLGRTFEKIIANSIDFENRKKEVDEVAVDGKLKKINKSKKINIKSIFIGGIIFLVLAVGGAVLYKINASTTYVLKKNQVFYTFKKNKKGISPKNLKVEFVNKDGNKIFFKYSGEKYYTFEK